MFATIETKGATHIIIHIPHDGAEKSLPALARMLEQNAKFITIGYQQAELTTPVMGVTLGNSFSVEGYNHDPLVVANSDAVLGDDFVNATPQVLTSNAVRAKKAAEEESRLRAEITYIKGELEKARGQIAALTAPAEE